MELLLTLNTVRHLRPIQVANRVARALRPWKLGRAAPGSVRLVRRAASRPAEGRAPAFDGRSFRFLNHAFSFEGPSRWNPSGPERLWVYNLHYFQYLWGLEPGQALGLVRDWIDGNRDGTGPGWEPYPLSLRIREWLEWLEAHPEVDATQTAEIVGSVARQADALGQQLEYHLLGNHLLENGITLCWAGLSLDGAPSPRWLAKGLGILRDELRAQCLPDGTHNERSPMYQALLAEALLRLAEVAAGSENPSASEVHALASSSGSGMLLSLARLVHPDGRYALVNDTALGVAPTHANLCRRFLPSGASPAGGRGIWALGDAGYFGWSDGVGGYLLFDAGPLGPDHQPGHGHADALSFELSSGGRQILTDTGVYTYAAGLLRSHDRSTAAHNTIEVDGRDQSELWAAFRCGRRARAEAASLGADRDAWGVGGSYHGPGRAFGGVRHRRGITAQGRSLLFEDAVDSSGSHTARLRLHLAPGLRPRREGNAWVLGDGARALGRLSGEGFDWAVTTSPYHPEFGVEVERPCLVAFFPFRDLLQLRWSLALE